MVFMVATRSKSKEKQDMDPMNKDIPSPSHNDGEEEIMYEEVIGALQDSKFQKTMDKVLNMDL